MDHFAQHEWMIRITALTSASGIQADPLVFSARGDQAVDGKDGPGNSQRVGPPR